MTTIIKRDGTREPFQAEKLTRWGRYAAQKFGSRVDWEAALVGVASELPDEISSAALQKALIQKLILQKSWPAYCVAGRLYAPLMRKEIHGSDEYPHLKDLHDTLVDVGYMRALDYSAEEYEYFNGLLNHELNLDYPHFQLEQLRRKYSLRNRSSRPNKLKRKEFETPQFVYMRMAMALAETQPINRRAEDVANLYYLFSRNKLNPPTPNYVNLGTSRHGYASCCLYTAKDDVRSLHAGDVIAYAMTYSSAGIGAYVDTRTVGDPVNGGLFEHQGRLRYYNAMSSGVIANSQAGRGGAGNMFYEIYNPEVEKLTRLKNPRTPADRRNRDIDFTAMTNKAFSRRMARNEKIFLFTSFSAPDLHRAFFSGDDARFEELYAKYEADPNFPKTYVSARDLYLTVSNEAYETGRNYEAYIDEINRHTPFWDTIWSSNLCVEIVQPTSAYNNIRELYSKGPIARTRLTISDGNNISDIEAWSCDPIMRRPRPFEQIYGNPLQIACAWQNIRPGDEVVINGVTYRVDAADVNEEPEVSLCSIGAVIVSNIEDDAEYEKCMYYGYLMIDKCIHMSHYELPHVGYTAKQRLNAAMGVMDLAHHMARKGLTFTSEEGKREIHRLAERHLWFAIKASCRLARELGPAPWAHRTRWAHGWTPVQSYSRNVDNITNFEYQYDWTQASIELIQCGGGRFSALVSFMPGESSSKGAGVANSIYPIREAAILKSDSSNLIYWAAPDGDILPYQSAWDIPTADMTDMYAIWQKFADGAISADEYRRIGPGERVPSSEAIVNHLYRVKMGIKTRYYLNTHTSKKVELGDGTTAEVVVENVNAGPVCGADGCAL